MNNIFLFGTLAEDVEELRHKHRYSGYTLDEKLAAVFDEIRKGTFGPADHFTPLVSSIADHGDYYLVSDDFQAYVTTQQLVDEAFQNQDEWIVKAITSVAHMGFFSTDRVINEYADEIWNVEPMEAMD